MLFDRQKSSTKDNLAWEEKQRIRRMMVQGKQTQQLIK